MAHKPHDHSHDHGHHQHHDHDHDHRVGGVPLHQHMLKVAGFASADVLWHEHPTAVIKASV